MKKFNLTLAFAFIAGLSAVPAFAQDCSDTEADTLRQCLDSGISICEGATADCDANEQAVSRLQVSEDAQARCCGKGNKAARKACLRNVRRFLVANILAGSSLRTFLRGARSQINDLLDNDCGNLDYEQLF